jgi:hypothetical protein
MKTGWTQEKPKKTTKKPCHIMGWGCSLVVQHLPSMYEFNLQHYKTKQKNYV